MLFPTFYPRRQTWDGKPAGEAQADCADAPTATILMSAAGERSHAQQVKHVSSSPGGISGRFTMATNDPHSAGCKRHDGRTSDSGCARSSHRLRRGTPAERSGRPMSTASAEARAQCAVQLRILHSLDRSRRRQRNPGDQDRSRAGQRADAPRPTESERNENSRDDHVCSRNGSRASKGRIRRRTGSGSAAIRYRRGFFDLRRLTAPPA
jgi:hypothetical protein